MWDVIYAPFGGVFYIWTNPANIDLRFAGQRCISHIDCLVSQYMINASQRALGHAPTRRSARHQTPPGF